MIFRATPQWFISMDESAGGKSLRQKALAEITEVKWHPTWGEGRLANMFKARPDWCVSRQRAWGVPIPVFYCQGCDEAVADPKIIDHVADIFARKRPTRGIAPRERIAPRRLQMRKMRRYGFSQRDRHPRRLVRLGFEHAWPFWKPAATRCFPADVYLEGGDQYRGWFNSSLSCGIVAHDTAPYKQIITHGWVVDGEGKKQSEITRQRHRADRDHQQIGADDAASVGSGGRVTPRTFAARTRSCSASSMRIARCRNTLRYALGNLAEFDPATDSVDADRMLEIDRWSACFS